MVEEQARNYRLIRLRQALQWLAQPVDVQLSLVGLSTEVADELALSVRYWANHVMVYEKGVVTDVQKQHLNELLSHLASMWYEGSQLWTADALQSAPAWMTVRHLAAEALAAFGWEMEVPQADQLIVIDWPVAATKHTPPSPVTLPEMLHQAIEQAWTAMIGDSQHQLRPSYRAAIYRAFGPATSADAHRTRTLLAVLTARHILSFWQQERPYDSLPLHLLELAEALVGGTTNPVIAGDELGLAMTRLERLSAGEGKHTPSCQAAGLSAIAAVQTALGNDTTFDEIVAARGNELANHDLDVWTADTALWAVSAWAGTPTGSLDPTRQRQFWEWWLRVAVPVSWQQAMR